MTALVLLTHESPERVRRMVDYWSSATSPAEIVVAYGGSKEHFDKIECRKAFIEDERLRTRDHQRERQSYTGVLQGVLAALEGSDWKWLYLAEYDMLPLDDNLFDRLEARAEKTSGDLLGHRMWRLDDTLHPHYASHLSTPQWLEWIESISMRADRRVVLSCMGCGQFWRREALEAVIRVGEPEPAYLELQLPTVAHHLGFRVRGMADQDRFISNHVIPNASADLLRDTGGWVMHPLKNLWKDPLQSRAFFTVASGAAATSHPASHSGQQATVNEMKGGWMGELDELLARIATVATGASEVRILRGGNRIAIGFPKDREAALVVLDLYHPNRLFGQIYRLIGALIARSTWLWSKLSLVVPPGGVPMADWLVEEAHNGRVGFVGGNPSHGPRCLLGGVSKDHNGELVPFVGKLGFDQSREAIEKEWKTLETLASRYQGVPRPLSFDNGDDWSLLRLPFLGYQAPRDMSDPLVISLLVGWWSSQHRPLGEVAWAVELLEKAGNLGISKQWCEKMKRQPIRRALVHGDLAVWNIRILPVGSCAIDWEWAEEDGVAGVDLVHGLRQEAVMVKRMSPSKAVRWLLRQGRKCHWEIHLRGCGWDPAIDDWLVFGLLHSHFNAKSDSLALLEQLGHRLSRDSIPS